MVRNMTRPGRRPAALLALLTAALLAGGAFARPPAAAASFEEKSRALAERRAEVEQLDTLLRSERAQGVGALRGLESRRAELAGRLDAERVQAAALAARVAGAEERLAAREGAVTALAEALGEATAATRAAVAAGLPFRRGERLAALDEILAKRKGGRLSPEAAATRLWRFLEDELGLLGQVERAELPVDLGGEEGERLLPVVRVGMLTLFTCLDDERFGRFVPTAEGWRHELVADREAAASLRRLFEALARQVREGAYVLPLPLAPGGAS